ncbi:cadherin-20-like [Salvelinus fontinalis]|uniref:cadherin-20-like n=1 Tax=Salvelinus fontinalis TaxID=8038 RepID=UPI002485776D|nr:cadherin-20-like [Salvelinus fontinalis]
MGDRHHHHPGGGRPVYTLLLSIGLALLALLSEAQGRMDRAKTEEESGAGLLRRVKRGWVWNQFFVLEEYTGLEPLYIGKLHSDMDLGDGSIKYILSGDGAGTTFTIDDSTGDIHAIKRLDREVKAQYLLRAQAWNRQTDRPLEPQSEFIVKIQDINDNEPKFLEGPYQATIPEMSTIGTEVIRMTATDADDPTYGNSARVVYSILQGQPYFSVEPKTGVVRVSLAGMDREVRENYSVIIQAKDMGGQLGGLAGTTVVNITLSDVNDNPPMFDQSKIQRRLSSCAVFVYLNSLQFMLKTVDFLVFILVNPLLPSYIPSPPLPPQCISSLVHLLQILLALSSPILIFFGHQYSIERNTDLGKYFYIDITSGALMTVLPLDREEFSWHNITVLAMEMNNPRMIGSVSVAVKILDVNDNPPLLTQYFEAFVCERANAGQLIQTVTAVDADDPLGGHHFYYSLALEAANNPNFTLRDNQDNTAWILTRRGGWSQQDQSVYYLPIFISDGEQPVQTSTSTLTIRVCSCDVEGNVMSCNAEAYHLPASLSRGALIAILACIFVLLVMVLLMLSLQSHRKKPYLHDEEDNVHENIVRYDDEGGGEEDTEAFDIAAMWNPREAHLVGKQRQDMLPEIESLSRYVPLASVGGPGSGCGGGDSNVQGYVLAKLLETDLNPCAPPYDSLQTYAYEGEGSVAESLSSLQSGCSNTDHEYDYLNDWGPRFKKLAEMYGVLETNNPPMW